MALFGKREKAYEVWGDKPRWKEARQRLKDAGIKIMETGYYETEAPTCGCGAKLDHRDFGPNGKIDRLTYYISVKPEDVARAKELLADLPLNERQEVLARCEEAFAEAGAEQEEETAARLGAPEEAAAPFKRRA